MQSYPVRAVCDAISKHVHTIHNNFQRQCLQESQSGVALLLYCFALLCSLLDSLYHFQVFRMQMCNVVYIGKRWNWCTIACFISTHEHAQAHSCNSHFCLDLSLTLTASIPLDRSRMYADPIPRTKMECFPFVAMRIRWQRTFDKTIHWAIEGMNIYIRNVMKCHMQVSKRDRCKTRRRKWEWEGDRMYCLIH